MSEVKAKEST